MSSEHKDIPSENEPASPANRPSSGANSSGRSIEEFFHAARQESQSELLGQPETERLLRGAAMSTSATTTFSSTLQKILFGTRIQTGLTLMTTTGLLVAAIVAANSLFTPTPPSKHSYVTQRPSVRLSATLDPAMAATVADLPFGKDSIPVSGRTLPSLPGFEDGLSKLPDSLIPIALSEAQLAKLGVELQPDGGIVYYQNAGKDEITKVKFGISNDSYITMGKDGPLNSDVLIGTLVPRLVTSPTGSRKLFSFVSSQGNGSFFAASSSYSQDSTPWSNPSASPSAITINTSENSGDNDNAPETLTNSSAQTNVTIIADDGNKVCVIPPTGISFPGSTSITIQSNGDSAQHVRHLKTQIQLRVNTNLRTTSSTDSATQANEFVMPNVDSIMKASGLGQNLKETLKALIDTIRDGGVTTLKISPELDSEVSVLVNNSEFTKQLAKGFDGLKNLKMLKELNGFNFNSDSGNVNMNFNEGGKSFNFSTPNFDSAFGKHFFKPGFFGQHMSHFPKMEFDFSHLIPVRVTNNSDPKHPNELIFWYDSIPATANSAMQPHTASVESHSAAAALSVYPNPTNGPAMIHYQIKDGTSAEFSIHNLLGQKMMDLGSSSGLNGDLEMNLSSLDAGVYLLICSTNTGDKAVERIVISK